MNIFINEKKILADVKIANNPVDRLKGLMFDKDMTNMDAFFIPRCNWIHTMFMRFPIDVIYLDDKYKIVDVDSNVLPWRMCLPRFKAKHVLELKSGFLLNNKIYAGEVLRCIV
ncbi:MAG: DUF192 domain-containing protein [bacterium]